MIPIQNTKFAHIAAAEALVDNAALATTVVDCLGYNYARIYFRLGTTDIALTALEVQESDASGSGFAAVTGLVYGTSTTIAGTTSALPTATSDAGVYVFDIDLRKRKRYLDLSVTFGDGTAGGWAYAFAILDRADISPTTAADAGVTAILRV
jgi:hypothetical protein